MVYYSYCATTGTLRGLDKEHIARRAKNTIWSFTEKKMSQKRSLSLERTSTHLSHAHLFHSSSLSLKITTSSKSHFLAYVVALINFLYHCILISSLYFITKHLSVPGTRCSLFINKVLTLKSEPGKQ